VIADGSGAIGLGGVMGGESTGCSDETTDVFVESAWFDPIRTAQTGRATGITSDAQYRFARGVDPGFMVDGLELATKLILELCGGEPSEVRVAGQVLAPPAPIAFDPAYVERLSGLSTSQERIADILTALGFDLKPADGTYLVQPPTWRRDVEGKADLVEEVARIAGYGALPATPLPELARAPGGVLSPRQARMRTGRRALAALGYEEAVTWSFVGQATAALFGGGTPELVLANPISGDLDCMRPSILPTLIEAVGRNAKRGFADVALFEIGPIFAGDRPRDQRTAITGVLAPHPPRRWDGVKTDDLFALKSDLMALLDDIGAPTGSMQVAQGQASAWWHPGRSARLQLGPKAVMAEFWLEAVPEPKRKAIKTRPDLTLSPLMPLSRDFAFLVEAKTAAGDLVRAVQGADKALITGARVFDVYAGAGVPDGFKSLAVEVTIQPREATLTDAEIEALSAKIVAAAGKAVGAKLRV
jgi:phenylalanyl-tRNA synthetase beta chain